MSNRDSYGIASRRSQRNAWPLGKGYRPLLHFTATVGMCAAVIAYAAARLDGVSGLQWLAVPGALLFANFFEWWVHRYLMHRPRRFLRVLYEKHTLMHHRLFHHDDMALYEWRELSFILLAAPLISVILVPVVTLGLGCGLLLGANVGWLTVLTLVKYVLLYELTHLSYHLPAGHPVRRIPGLGRLARHHARHHDPRVMSRGNFNVTFPLADLVLGTYFREDR